MVQMCCLCFFLHYATDFKEMMVQNCTFLLPSFFEKVILISRVFVKWKKKSAGRRKHMDLVKKWSRRVKRMKKIKRAFKSIRKNAKKIRSSFGTILKAITNTSPKQ